MTIRFRGSIALVTLVTLLGLSLAQKDELPPEVVATLKGHTEAVYVVGYSPDGKYVVTGSYDRTLKVFEAATGKEFKTFAGPQGHQQLVIALALSPDGTFIASGSSDNTVKVWDFPSSKAIRSLAHPAEINGVALSPDGKLLAGAGKDGIVKLWNAADGKQLF